MQRVRCSRLPPIEAMLRTWADALANNACAITGKRSRTPGSSATSLMRASAPEPQPLRAERDLGVGQGVDVDQIAGAAAPSFISCIRSVPPAMKAAPSTSATRRWQLRRWGPDVVEGLQRSRPLAATDLIAATILV